MSLLQYCFWWTAPLSGSSQVSVGTEQPSPIHLLSAVQIPSKQGSFFFVTCQYLWTARAGKDVRDPVAQFTHLSREQAERGEITSPEIM